jgi:type VI secretion system secreted protein VgrG
VQTAVVTGPKGEEVYVDDHARVKVQFHWDRYGKRDENSSCWVRVSQAWAGKGYGFISHPRIGQEVIVDFEEGDPDRPIITGRVYNADQKQHTPNAGRDGKPGNVKPTSQPQTKMMTSFKSNSLGGSGGYNEIAMNDTAGAEGLFFKAQKDEIHKVGNNREDTVGNNETRKVAMDRSREVGNNEKIEVGGNQTITVGSNKTETIAIASTETVGAAKALSVGAAYVVTVAGGMNTAVGLVQFEEVGLSKTVIVGTTFSLQAADEIILQTGMSTIRMLKNGKIEISGTDITLKSGEGKINIDPGGVVTLIGPVVKINPDETNF